MNVRFYGGPMDGQIVDIPESLGELPIVADGPTMPSGAPTKWEYQQVGDVATLWDPDDLWARYK